MGSKRNESTLALVLHVLTFSWMSGYLQRPFNPLHPTWQHEGLLGLMTGGGPEKAREALRNQPQGFSAPPELQVGRSGQDPDVLLRLLSTDGRTNSSLSSGKFLAQHIYLHDFLVPLVLTLPFCLPRTQASLLPPVLPTQLSWTVWDKEETGKRAECGAAGTVMGTRPHSSFSKAT